MRELELYIHIPFCMKKCDYCDFLSAPADEKSQSAYMEGLKREIAYYGEKLAETTVTTIYIGGGTPSWLQESYIAELMEEVRKHFNLAKNAEISIECNPGTLTKGKLECYLKSGINRLSIGLQSTDNEELQNLGRIHTYEQFLRNYELARECGFKNINIDLMNALPKQTVEKYYDTLMKVIRLNPEHISSYSLIIEKGTPFYDRYKFDLVKQEAGLRTEELPSENTIYQMGKMSEDVLAEHGYRRYEISNYSKRGYECRHNIGYWQRKEYLGVGLGASSLLNEVRYSNLTNLGQYIEKSLHIEELQIDGKISTQTPSHAVAGVTNLHAEANEISKNAQMEEFMFLGLRMINGIEKSDFYRAFGFTVDHIYGKIVRKLQDQELIVDTPTRLFLTERGLDLSNYVLAQFLL